MRPSPLLSAAAGVALLAAVALPAGATTPAPARGVASTSVTLLGVAAGGHTLTAGTVALLSDMLQSPSVAQAVLTPLTADGEAYGRQSTSSGQPPLVVEALDSGQLLPALAGLAALRSPLLRAGATDDDGQPSSSASAGDLGGVSVLGLPLSLTGSVDVGSSVTRAGGALSGQTLVVEDVALPSVAALLAALGLDLSALPVDVLVELLEELDLVTDAVDDAQAALDAALAGIQTQVDAAQRAVEDASADVSAQLQQVADAAEALSSLEQDLAAALAPLGPLTTAVQQAQDESDLAAAELTRTTTELTDLLGGLTVAAYEALPQGTKDLLGPTVAAAYTAYTTAQQAVADTTTALTDATSALADAQSLVDALQVAVDAQAALVAALQGTLDGLQAVLDAAVSALQDLLDTVPAELAALIATVTAVLDTTPLLSLDSLTLTTRSAVTSAADGGQQAVITGGELTGLEVLGTDVLTDVLGTRSVDVLQLLDGTVDEVEALVGQLTGALSQVLSTVPQFPSLSVPAPQVGVLVPTASTGVADGFGTAGTSLTGLSITVPSISLPLGLALPDAAALPALGGITQVAGQLTSAPVRIDLASLANDARFAPAAADAGEEPSPAPSGQPTGTPAPTQPPGGAPTTSPTPGPTTGPPSTGGTPGADPTPIVGGGPVLDPQARPVPQLPRTGASSTLAAAGLVLLVAAAAVRRRELPSA